ncbi:DUF2787 family protein [Vibrio parahaemolyticus]|nr:DUF2787 family protein [Vibrio parahaemolyticus]
MSQTKPHPLLVEYLQVLVSQLAIPANAKRIVLNFRVHSYYQSRKGFHPLEIQLEKQSDDCSPSWRIVFIASFSYPDEQANNVEVELYFNFLRSWFYQPDISRCDLHQPQVTELYTAYERSVMKQIKESGFDDIRASLVSVQPQPLDHQR